MKPAVFVSSVIEGYESFRTAAGEAVLAVGGTPIRVETEPSFDRSSRNACLDLVENADVYLLLVGARGGWVAPSGLTATEEEFQHAKRLGKRMLVFVEEGSKDAAAERLATDASDYVEGRFRRTYSDAGGLCEEVQAALDLLLPELEVPKMDAQVVEEAVAEISTRGKGYVCLRLACAPERSIDLVDPLKFEDADFIERLQRLGHNRSVGLFSYERGKSVLDEHSRLVIEQDAGRDPTLHGRLEIHAHGVIATETSVTGRKPRQGASGVTTMAVLLEEDVRQGVERCLAAARGILDLLDPHKRSERVLLNGSLGELGYRTWQEKMPSGGAVTMRTGGPEIVRAFDGSRSVARTELEDPEALLDRLVGMLRRGVQNRRGW